MNHSVVQNNQLTEDCNALRPRAGRALFQNFSNFKSCYQDGQYNVMGMMIHSLSFGTAKATIIAMGKSRQKGYVAFSNVHMLVQSFIHPSVYDVVSNATLRLPDGMPLCKAVKLIYGKNVERISGMDMLPVLLAEAEKENLSIYFLGSQESFMKKFFERQQKEYPNLKIAGYYTGMVSNESEANQALIDEIRTSGAHIVCVCLGCPKQELWMSQVSPEIPAVLLGLGAAFAVYAGVIPRAPYWMQQNSLEWLHRLINDPIRLWRRYAVTNTIFLGLIFIQFLCHHIKRILPHS